ncbi:right-handed parallel beta-helix repeat-containing protein [Streptomyces poriferorum]|uniref:right-handed parallel beta-helix repeat-containing protein n=1 Tax=Streptomyces TaxID=1883 RepID=UPI00273DCA60|nr:MULTISPECIES: right-handed parallel beta-helix repeat-containing protein [unclassified Streptomyces]WLQ46057.1 right-handed parallel beta-helix repeat-containing protein [Streptomyces sp. Alt1]WSI60852.1 right-handed parallel beta-helix repeat-containing protein [Streptomyces sp. NBC_01336]
MPLTTLVRNRSRLPLLLAAGALLVSGATLNVPDAQAQATGCKATDLFVAPDGSDRAKGTEASPFKTIEGARDHIRDKGLNRPGRMRCDINVNLRAGDYPVSTTINFDDRDSGADGHRVVYRSYDGAGKARVMGAAPVTGWEEYKDGIYRADVGTDKPFYTLFEDGKRATTARYPNRKSDDEWAPYMTSVLSEPEKEAVRQWLYSSPGDWDASWNLDQASAVVWSGGSWSWFTDTVPIRDWNAAKNQMTLKYWTRYALMNSRGGSRYFLQNSLDFLDQAGEYYMDFKKGQVYYKPRGDINDVTVLRPTVKTLFNLAGPSPDRRVQNLSLDGLSLQYTDFVDWYRYGWISDGDSGEPHKYPEYDRQIELPRNRFGAVTVTNSKDITLSRLHMSDTGYHAVYALFANDGLTVRDSLLENIGGDGIKVEGPYPGEGNTSNGHLLTNNYITHYGELVPGDASGIELQNTGHNTISHSHIKHSARYGVSLEVRPEVAPADDYARDNTFEYLRIDQAGLDSGDMGAFYTYGVSNVEPHTIDNHVRQMVIGDVIPDGSMPDSGTRGVHMDAGGCGFSFENIEVGKTTDQSYQSYQCNDVKNANWEDGYDASKMEYDKIGVSADFPYPLPEGDTQ